MNTNQSTPFKAKIPDPAESFRAIDKAIKEGKPVRNCYQCGAGLLFDWPSDYCEVCRPVRSTPQSEPETIDDMSIRLFQERSREKDKMNTDQPTPREIAPQTDRCEICGWDHAPGLCLTKTPLDLNFGVCIRCNGTGAYFLGGPDLVVCECRASQPEPAKSCPTHGPYGRFDSFCVKLAEAELAKDEWRVERSYQLNENYNFNWCVMIKIGIDVCDFILIERVEKEKAEAIAKQIVEAVNKNYFGAWTSGYLDCKSIYEPDVLKLCAELEQARAKISELEHYIFTFKLYFEMLLQTLKYRNTSPAGAPNQANGYAYAEISDWEIKQKIEGLSALLEKNK